MQIRSTRITDLAKRALFPLLFIGVLMLAYKVYAPGLYGTFAFDDSTNILQNSAIEIKNPDVDSLKLAAISGRNSALKRPLAMMSFGLNYYWAKGFVPYDFKLTNLLIHLLNGILVFFLAFQVLRIYRLRFRPQLDAGYLQWVSLAVASAWLLHPLCLTSVLYVVQRMTSLSALFIFAGLIVYLRGRLRLFNGESGAITHMVAAVLVFLPMAVLCKENGILLPLFMLVLEITLFDFAVATAAGKKFLGGFYAATIVIPAVAGMAYLAMHPDFILGGYRLRDFTLTERLLTEPRILWFYLKMILLPKPADMGLFHDDIAVSHGLFEPVSTFASLILLLALGVAGFLSRKRYPIVSLGLLFFLAGHLLESTFLPLEITFEHRNYVPMAGIILMAVFYLLHPLANRNTLRLRQAGMILLIGILAAGTAIRATHWGDLFLLTASEVAYHPESYRANAEMGAMYGNLAAGNTDHAEEYYRLSRTHFEKSAELNKKDSDGLFGLIYYSSRLDHKIEPRWMGNLLGRLEHAPYVLSNTEKLYLLEGCMETGECRLSKGELSGLLDASLQNATLGAEQKARLLTIYGQYWANLENNDDKALGYMREAVATMPTDPNFRANLIEYLISRKQMSEAGKELALARKVDVYGSYKRQFLHQEELINAASVNK